MSESFDRSPDSFRELHNALVAVVASKDAGGGEGLSRDAEWRERSKRHLPTTSVRN